MKKIYSILSLFVVFTFCLVAQYSQAQVMVVPSNGATDQSLTTSIYVSVVTGATNYTIEIDTVPSFANIIQSKSGSRIQTFSGLLYNKTYYVRAKTELTNYGAIKFFSTISGPTTYMTEPNSGTTCFSKSSAIYAKSLTGATSYTWEFNTASDFTGTSIIKTTSSYYVILGNNSGVSDFITYYVRVKAVIPSQSITTAYGLIKNISFTSSGAAIDNIRISGATSSPASRTYTVTNNNGSTYTWSVPGGVISSGQGTNTIITNGSESSVSVTETNSCGRNVVVSSAAGQVRSSVWAPITGTTGFRNQFKIWFAPVPGITNPASYRVQVSTSPSFTSNVLNVVGNASQTVGGIVYPNYNNISNLAYNTCYYLRVSVNGGTYGNVTTICTGAPKTNLTSPASGATNVPTKSYFESGVVTGATNYTLELDLSSSFNTPNKITVNSSTHGYHLQTLLFNKTYYARIKATVGGVVQPYGNVTTFTTETAPVTFLTGPTNGTTNYPKGAYFYAKDAGNVSSYDWEFNTASDFTGVSILKSSTINSVYAGDQLQYSTTYYVRVKANVASQGISGAYNASFSFTTAASTGRIASEEEQPGLSEFIAETGVFPNPVTANFNVCFIEEQGVATLEIFETNGTLVKKQQVDCTRGLNKIAMEKGNMKPGMYLIKVSGSSSTTIYRMVIE